MGLQWEKQFLQWAGNGLAMGLQWVCNGILVGLQWAYVTFLIYFERREWTPLQTHCRPIAGMALRKHTPYPVAHCRTHSGPTGDPFARPSRAHCTPHCMSIAGPLRTHYWPIARPKVITSCTAGPLPGHCGSLYISSPHELQSTKTFITQIANYLPLSDRLAASCGRISPILNNRPLEKTKKREKTQRNLAGTPHCSCWGILLRYI